jgi:hypothetical protein
VRLHRTFHGYYFPAERLTFRGEAKVIIEKVLEARPTVLNISASLQDTIVETIVKVRSAFSAFSVIKTMGFHILAYQSGSPCGGKPALHLHFRDDNLFIMVRALQEITTGQRARTDIRSLSMRILTRNMLTT